MSQAEAHISIDHDEIRRWVEKRGGKPSDVKRTAAKRGEAGILRIDFPGYSGEDTLEEIPWDEFFDKFEKAKLAFLYQETTADGKRSNFNKLISRPAILESGRKAPKAGATGSSRTRSRTAAKAPVKAAKAPVRAKSQTRSKAKTQTAPKTSRTKAAAMPKTAPKAKATAKAAPKRKAASQSKARTTFRTTTKPQTKAKSQSGARSAAKAKPAAKTQSRTKAKARAKAR